MGGADQSLPRRLVALPPGNGSRARTTPQLSRRVSRAFADAAGRRAARRGRRRASRGGRRRGGAAALPEGRETTPAGPTLRDVRLASPDFREGHFAEARDGELHGHSGSVPMYGRAHAVARRSSHSSCEVDDALPRPGSASISARAVGAGSSALVATGGHWPAHPEQRGALGGAVWAFVPVLVDGGATFYVQPLWMRLDGAEPGRRLRTSVSTTTRAAWTVAYDGAALITVDLVYPRTSGAHDADRYIHRHPQADAPGHGVLPRPDDSRAIQDHTARRAGGRTTPRMTRSPCATLAAYQSSFVRGFSASRCRGATDHDPAR